MRVPPSEAQTPSALSTVCCQHAWPGYLCSVSSLSQLCSVKLPGGLAVVVYPVLRHGLLGTLYGFPEATSLNSFLRTPPPHRFQPPAAPTWSPSRACTPASLHLQGAGWLWGSTAWVSPLRSFRSVLPANSCLMYQHLVQFHLLLTQGGLVSYQVIARTRPTFLRVSDVDSWRRSSSVSPKLKSHDLLGILLGALGWELAWENDEQAESWQQRGRWRRAAGVQSPLSRPYPGGMTRRRLGWCGPRDFPLPAPSFFWDSWFNFHLEPLVRGII